MASRGNAAGESPIVSRDRVIDCVRTELRVAVTVERRLTVEQISNASGVAVRALRTYMDNDPTEAREPSTSALLSIAVVLGERAINSVLALIGYGGARPLDEPDQLDLHALVADSLADFTTIASAAADGRIDHTEQPGTQRAADHLIQRLIPLSSAGRAE